MSTIIKNFKSWTAVMMAFGFVLAISLSGCSDTKKDSEASDDADDMEMMDTMEDSTEHSEHPADDGDHEHPSDSTETAGSEHPGG
jgi:hypothetical protein